jgi:hypothetical protein
MKWWLIAGGVLGAVFVIGLATGVVHCRVTVTTPERKGFDPAEIEAKLRANLATVGEVRNVNCGVLEPKLGSTATCMVTFTEGPTREVTLVVEPDDVKMRTTVELADVAKLRAALAKLLPETTEVRCQTNVELDFGRAVPCHAVLTDGATAAIRAYVDDERVRWEAVAPVEMMAALVRARLAPPAGTRIDCRAEPSAMRCTIGDGAATRAVRAVISATDGSLSIEPVEGAGSAR